MKVQRQNEAAEDAEPTVSNSSGNGSGFATPQESESLVIEKSRSGGLAGSKATGPRTEQGKQRASLNSTKHGVFSKVVVLRSESRAEYDELLARLREALQPEGALEELLVEKLATTTWRQRRLLLAEGAEIRENMGFVESDHLIQEHEAAEKIVRPLDPLNHDALIGGIHNPEVLERCLELLAELHEQIEKNGLNPKSDHAPLEKIYGDREQDRLREDLYDSYQIWLDTSEDSEEERAREGYASPAQCRTNVLHGIDEEIRRLRRYRRYRKVRTSIEAARTQLEIQRRNVPEAPTLDRLLRYDVTLDRSFDRTLTQLERLQRMRRGLPVPPPLKVDIS